MFFRPKSLCCFVAQCLKTNLLVLWTVLGRETDRRLRALRYEDSEGSEAYDEDEDEEEEEEEAEEAPGMLQTPVAARIPTYLL